MIKKDGTLVKHFWYQKYEFPRVERFLEDMARKGWMLKQFEDRKFTFHPCEPKEVTFSLNIFDDSAAGGPFKEAKKLYMELCEKAGWSFVASQKMLYIFCTEDTNAIPIETDDRMTLDSIHKNIIKENKYDWILLPAIALFFIYSQMRDIKYFVTDYVAIFAVCVQLFIFLNGIIGIITYLIWYLTSKKRIENGLTLKFYDGINRSIFLRFSHSVTMVIGIAAVIIGVISGNLFMLVLFFFIFILLIFYVHESRIEGWSRKKQVLFLSGILLSIMLLTVLSFYFFVMYGRVFLTKHEPVVYYEDGGLVFQTISHEEVPITIEEYEQKELSLKKDTIADVSSTILAQDYVYDDFLLNEEEDYLDGLHYEVFQSEIPWLLDSVMNQELSNPTDGITYTEDNPSQFKSKKLYTQELPENAGYRYIAVYENKVLTLEVSEKPTSQQIQLFLEKLIFS